MSFSTIEWTEMTWNPTTGCNKISQGCKFCYAEVMTKRLTAMGIEKYKKGFKIAIHPETLDIPRKWKKPRLIFVNSMSDLFHPGVPLSFIKKVFKTMNECPQHTFQVLTKRADRLHKLSDKLTWTKNIWMGVSVEHEKVIDRIDYLRETGAFVKFLSLEPLIGPLSNLDLTNINWAIVGGESGPKSRQMLKEWVIEIKDQCEKQNVGFFFKQWGGRNKKQAGRILEGNLYSESPNNVEFNLYYQKQA